MIVSHAKKFIFFHNPKCAGTSFRDALKPWHDDPFTFWGIYPSAYFRNQLDHTHLRLWELRALFPRLADCAATYNSVIFVRNPHARFLSAVNEHMKKFQPQIDLAGMDDARRISVIEAFIQNGLTIARIMTDWRFIHFSPQTWFLRFGNDVIPRNIIPMHPGTNFMEEALATLNLPAIALPHHNPSPIDLTAALASPIVTNCIQSLYAEDFAYFTATPNFAALVQPE
jgi:hypothetical protein